MLNHLSIEGYRSLREFSLSLGRVNVLTGPNGCGKTNVYSAVRLLKRAAEGQLARCIADEGGMPAVLWAGPRKRRERQLVVLCAEFDDFSYELEIGLPPPDTQDPPPEDPTMFPFDPLVKEERVQVAVSPGRRVVLCERDHALLRLRDEHQRLVAHPAMLDDNESVLSQVREPQQYPELIVLGRRFAAWRFYHDFRSDADAPARRRQISVRTPAMSDDGSDLVPALRTIHELGDVDALDAVLSRVLPDWEFEYKDGFIWMNFQPEQMLHRFDLRAASDGMMRFLYLAAVLMSPRPPELLVLNEPENSLYPGLLEPLAELVAGVSAGCQVLLTTHSERLAALIAERTGEPPQRLEVVGGATRVVA
ncbi:MAG: AAA family ATPase [Phycisphaerae bacterium]|nr:AAA family ATPase [Phycisphaerae bacterium]